MKKSVRAYLDRIEGETAVLYLGDDEDIKIDIPLYILPEDCREGDVFKLSFKKEKNSDIGKEVENLRRKLLENND